MIVQVLVSWQRREYDEGLCTDVPREFTIAMWFDPADLVQIKDPIDTGGLATDYKRELTATRVDTDERVRLQGCWSHKPGELIADVVTPIAKATA